MRLLVIAAAAAVAIAAPAAAQTVSKPEISGSVGYSHFVEEGSDGVGAITARLSGRLHANFGIEAEGSFGVTSTDVSGLDFEMKNTIAVYAVGYLPLSDNFDLIGRVGYGRTEFEISGGGLSASLDDAGFTGGLGAIYRFDDKNGIRADVTRHQYKDLDAGWDALSVAYVRRF